MKTLPFLACALLVLNGCASQPKEPPRIQMQGFSISTPAEKEPTWLVAKQSPMVTVIGKPGRFSGETFTMQASVISMQKFASTDDLIRHVESTQRKELDPRRYRLFKLEVHEQKMHGQPCALSRVEAAERTTSETTGSPVNIMLETLTLICAHPQDPTKGINMAYSHRHFPEDNDPQFAEDAALLMGTLKFEPL